MNITIYYRTEEYKVLDSGRTSYATSATSDIKREQGLNYFIKYVLRFDTTMLRKFENENKNQNKKNLRLKIYGKIRNGRLKLEPSVLIKKTCTRGKHNRRITSYFQESPHRTTAIQYYFLSLESKKLEETRLS